MENRIVDFVITLDSENERNISEITKRLINQFGIKFRLTRLEADYLSDYLNGNLNFGAPIINFNNRIK